MGTKNSSFTEEQILRIVHNDIWTCIYVGYTFTLTSPGKSNQKEAFGMAFLPLFFRTKIWNITPPIRYTARRLKNLTKEREKPVFNHIYEYLTHQIIAKKIHLSTSTCIALNKQMIEIKIYITRFFIQLYNTL